ncbi:MAG: DUF6807 family protein [Verrucomicrobiales bacterium]
MKPHAFLLAALTCLAAADDARADAKFRVTPTADGVDVPVFLPADKWNGTAELAPEGAANLKAGDAVLVQKVGDQIVFILPKAEAGKTTVWEQPLAKAKATEFGFAKEDGKHLDFQFGGQSVLRTMIARDESTKESKFDTAKVFTHVFAPDGESFLTKGTGGQYPHHRGIYLGWSRTGFGGKKYDTWHCHSGEALRFDKVIAEEAGPVLGRQTIGVKWTTPSGDPILDEARTLTLYRQNAGDAIALIDVDTVLSANYGEVELNGDPEHAGCQFRPTNEVSEKTKKETKYLFPAEGNDPKKDRDLPWAGLAFTAGGQRYHVQHMSHPTIPEGNIYSAYRDYGRFGAFCKTTIKDGESLRLRYRLYIGKGEMPERDAFAQRYAAFAEPPKVEVVE